MTKPMFKLIS